MQALFNLLAASSRPLLLVGGHALTAYNVVRQTIDVDCLIAADDRNTLAHILRGGGYREIGSTENAVRYVSSAPELPDVDVLLVDAATFERLFGESNILRRGQHDFPVPSLRHLIALKLHAIRNDQRREARDFADIAELLRANSGKISREELQQLSRRFAPAGFETKLLTLL
jgi:nucleotidyltransferase AbiEii toxin of type IV toxin-antitoxin system